jgi:hypothetical protein
MHWRVVEALPAAAAAALLIGCAAMGIGLVRPSAEVDRQFRELEINPNYGYWHLNRENTPFGILGLDREYRFIPGSLWVPLDPDAATFKKVVGLVESFPLPGSVSRGFEILEPGGRRIGVWYSSLNAGFSVDAAAKEVSATTEALWRQR